MYKIKGADQKEYGPVSADQIRQWFKENRLNRFSMVEAAETPGWRPLELVPEFADLFPAALPPAMGGGGFSAIPTSISTSTPGPRPVIADPVQAAAQLKVPGILLIVFAICGLLLAICAPFTKKAMVSFSSTFTEKIFDSMSQPMPPEVRAGLDASKNQGFGVMDGFGLVMGLVSNVVMLIGALKMMKLESWGLALAAAILVMLPCGSCCCCLGIGLGVWVAILLSKPEIKGAFR